MQNGNEAKTLGTTAADKFTSYANVVYEAFDASIDSSMTCPTLKTTAQCSFDTIRGAVPADLTVNPSMRRDEKPGEAAASPLDGKNLVCAAHVYPGD